MIFEKAVFEILHIYMDRIHPGAHGPDIVGPA